MATSGQVNTNTTYDSYFWVKWSEKSQDTSTNKTTINWSCGVYCGHTFYTKAIKMSAVKINGTTVYSGGTYSNYSVGNHTISSGTLTISHNTDGTKNFTISAFTGWLYADHDYESKDTSFTLDTISRYATINTFTVSKKDETSVTVTFTTDVTCDYIWYSKDNGTNWTGINITDGTSGSFNITGLTANTSYNFKLRVRRKDSQLSTDSSTYTQTTYNYPYCNSAPNFTIGDRLTLGLYNPLGRSIKINILGADGSQCSNDTITGTSISGYNGDAVKGWLYQSLPNAQSGVYKVEVTYGTSVITVDGGTYKIKGDEIPTINEIKYGDTLSEVVSITSNAQQIVQNQSNLVVTFDPATPNYHAGSIKKFVFELNGKTITKTTNGGTAEFGKVNSANDLPLKVTVTDSRGLTATKEITITMLEHKEPTAVVTLERLNNYEDETYLTVDGSVSSIDGNNTIFIEYRYKIATDEYTPFVAIPNSQKQTLTCDKNSIYVFNVVVTDAFGTKYDREFILYKGVFPLFIDTEKNAVGINDFPAEGEALCVAEGVARFNDGIVLLSANKKFLIKITDNGAFSITEMKEGE